ncbi:tRNA uridine-5-carboxymethylaminomethyl(34) synthesis GTPase MnmE [Marinilabilia rubra]|uniref:tRNA modification GTPase MnmE n=1 Tax=Marinilabilia rubra TaxID=2162893 RepID=A0A2U2BAH3_9BACT|nr:tRNA uridine-5-carboxymethylaminomethyl(34) synthesis GTPase MnmE [Marinilabilia rubra]PWE00033.1 tRNA uridine-5-carboxymethylaminomethyl(34) synthesis GTPase MnmE [Marinilabilia rubra]
MILEDTICAISTAPGAGAIAVLRLAGPKAFNITENVFRPAAKNKSITEQAPNTVHFGTIYDGENDIDEVVITLFKSPKSFTGDDIVEISCHGAVFIQQKILQLLTDKGARLAKPGEFTQRSFLNGKMDLSQAEAVADLIAARSEAARRVALKQMKGGFSNELINLRSKLLEFTSLIELELDFSEEDVEFADRSQLIDLVLEIEHLLKKLIDSFSLGNAIKNGIPVAIVGHTNAGKSTLLNALLQEERALVSDVHGTTRDVIEDVMNIQGITFRFIDTAGIRNTIDKVESMGIALTYNKIKQASIIVLMMDAQDEDAKIHQAVSDVKRHMNSDKQQLIVVVNKTDLVDSEILEKRFSKKAFRELTGTDSVVPLSAKMHIHLDRLTSELLKTMDTGAIDNDEVVVTNARHYEALKNALEGIQRTLEGLQNGISGDFLSQDIREVLHYLGEITGQISTDEVLGNIFKNFCIGK